MRAQSESDKKANPEPELHQAAERGDSAKFLELLATSESDIFSLNSEGSTVLNIVATKLEQSRFNPFANKAPFREILTAIESHIFFKLCEAMQRSDEEFARLFELVKKAPPSSLISILKGPKGWSPKDSMLKAFGLLLASMPFASEEHKAKQKEALQFARLIGLAPGRGVRCAQLILEAGKAVKLFSPIEADFVHAAALYSTPEMLNLLISNNAEMRTIVRGPLFCAIYSGQIESVNLILQWWPSLFEWSTEANRKPWHYAVRCGHLEIVKRFFRSYLSSQTLLIEAAKEANEAIFDFAVSTGATDLNAALAQCDTFNSVKLLVKKGAGSCIPNWPIYNAEYTEQPRKEARLSLLALLMSGSYQITTRTLTNWKPVCITERRAEILEKIGYEALNLSQTQKQDILMAFKLAPFRMKIFELIDKNDSKGLSAFLEDAKANFDGINFRKILNSRDEQTWTPLQKARNKGFNECVKLLMDEGAPEQFSLELERSAPVPSAPPLSAPTAAISNEKQVPVCAPEKLPDPNVLRLKELVEYIRKNGIDIASLDSEFICPISREIMCDPVVASDEQSYDRQAFSQNIAEQKQRGLSLMSPGTGQPLESEMFIANASLRKLIIKNCEALITEHEKKKTVAVAPESARPVPPASSLIRNPQPPTISRVSLWAVPASASAPISAMPLASDSESAAHGNFWPIEETATIEASPEAIRNILAATEDVVLEPATKLVAASAEAPATLEASRAAPASLEASASVAPAAQNSIVTAIVDQSSSRYTRPADESSENSENPKAAEKKSSAVENRRVAVPQ